MNLHETFAEFFEEEKLQIFAFLLSKTHAQGGQLQIGQTGSVVDGEELVIPESPDPSTNGHLLACEGGVEQLRNRVALHFGVF